MANDKGGGPGTTTRGQTKTTLYPPFNKPGKGEQNGMTGPFDKARSGGDNGLPTHVYDNNIKSTKSTPKPGVYMTAPSSQGPNRPGTVQNRY
jgi:hypothetical protein